MDLSFVTRKFQRSIAGLSLLAILASFAGFTGTAFALTFSDVSSDYFAYDQIGALSDDGIMTGYENGLFGADDTLTREQAAKILVQAFVGSVDSSYDAGFSDVEAGMWYTDYVNTAALYGIVAGYTDASGVATGVFGVANTVNRAEFAKMVVSAAGLESDGSMASSSFSDVSAGSWYDTYMGTAWAYSIMDGYSNGMAGPADGVTRGQAAKMTYNAMNPVYRGTEVVDETETGSADATVTVSVSDDTPSADTIPSAATSVELASFDLTATGDDTAVDGLTVHQYGISSAPSDATVYLYNGSERLTSGTTVNSTTHESDFRNLNVEIEEGETVTLTVRMDMGTWTSSGEVGFEIASTSKVDVGDSAVEGNFPAMAEKFSVSTTSVGSVTVEKNGSIDNAQVGADDSYIGKLKLTAGSVEGGYVKELGLYVAGTISTADVENLRLYVTGDDAEPIAQVANVDDLDVARFVIGEGEGVMDGLSDGYLLEKGNSKSFYVLADLNTGRTGDTVQMYIDQNTDVQMIGDLYGYGLSVVRTTYDGGSCTSSSGDCTFQTLTGGDITISSNGPAASDIAINGKDLTLMNFIVTSVSDVTFDNFPVALTASEAESTEGLLNSTAANFTDIKIVDTDSGSQLYSSVDATSLTTVLGGTTAITEVGDNDNAIAYYLWTDDWMVEAGSEYNLAVKSDVANTSTLDAMTIVASLPLGATYPGLKDTNNKTLTNSSVLVPSSTITGKTMTIKAPSLTLSLASTPSAGSTTKVKGSQDVQFTGIVFACGQSTDCKVTDLILQGYLNGAVGAGLSADIGSVSLVDGDGNTIAEAKSVNTTSATVTYTSMDWTIDAGDTAIAYVTGDLSSSATATDQVAFGVSSASNVTVENSDGNSFSATGTVNVVAGLSTGTYVTVSGGGSLTLSVDGSTPKETIVLAGAAAVEFSRFTFTATDEAFVVKQLAVNNRGSALTNSTTIQDYDDNITKVQLSYTNSDGISETKDGYLSGGVANFVDLDIYVESNSDAVVKVLADMNTVTNGADTGDTPEFNIALNNFLATGQGTGDTFKADKLDAGVAATSDFDIGTISFTDSIYNVQAAGAVVVGAAGTSQAITLDAGSLVFPVGTLLFEDENSNATYDEAGDNLFVTTATWSTTVPTVMILNNGNASMTANRNIYYALGAVGYLTSTNRDVVYETKPTLSLNASNPTGSHGLASADTIFRFDVTAGAGDKINIRAASALTTCTDTSSITAAITASGTVDGSACSVTAIIGADDYIPFATTNVQNYKYASFWVKFVDGGGASSVAITSSGLRVGTSEVVADPATANVTTQRTSVSAANVGGSSVDTFVNGTWTFVHDVLLPTATDSGDVNVGVSVSGVINGLDDAADALVIDQFVLYNDKITVDLASDASLTAAANAQVAYLRGGSSDITGYIFEDTTSSAQVTFFPTVELSTAKSSTTNYYVETATTTLITDQTGVDDTLTPSITYGTFTDGTIVTAGGFWWNDTTAVVLAAAPSAIVNNVYYIAQWLGYYSSSTLVSSPLKY